MDIMLVALSHGIQLLQDQVHLMWEYNCMDDATRAIRYH